MTHAPTVVIVDDHGLFRSGVRTELEGVLEVLGDAASVGDAVRLILERKPDVVLLDVHMPGGGGVEVIRQVAATRPGQRFLALSVSDAAEDVIAIVRAGARGYVTKTISGEELADAVRRVHDGDASSPRAWRASCSTRSPASCPPSRSTRSSTCSPPASARSSSTWRAATSTRRSPRA
jgi:DNA-binding NarL/FixJ family response regulator